MTQFLAVGRLAPLLLVLTFLHFPQEEHLAAKAHDGAGATINGGSQAINEQLNPARSAPLVLERVTVIAGNRSPARRDAIVFIRDGRIVQVGASNRFVVPPNSQRVDATGKFAIPGRWDMHVHLFNNFTGEGTQPDGLAPGEIQRLVRSYVDELSTCAAGRVVLLDGL
jgi:imidazolonepropionase-like amidohydrolase